VKPLTLSPLTADRAYFLGLFCADGNVTRNRNGSWYVELTSKDRPLLEFTQKLFDVENKLSERRDPGGGNTRYRIQIGSKRLAEELGSLGLGPRKSARMALPAVPDLVFPHFLRGYFDGDGNVLLKNYRRTNRATASPVFRVVFTSASEGFLRGLWDRLISLGVTRRGALRREGAYFRLVFSTNDSHRVGQFMYNAPRSTRSPIALQRKREIFLRRELGVVV
jgi:intein/homing endonuclease